MAATETTTHSFNTGRSYKSPLRKLVAFFEKSRDKWKQKYHALKVDFKREQNQRRAVERSRADWRSKAEASEQRVRELEQQLEDIKALDNQKI